MRTKRIKIYKFSELSEEAKNRAIEKLGDINVDCDWWQSVYDDAKVVGIKITSFDIDRGSYCKGKFIEDACFTANKIVETHGEMCETYKTAQAFLTERNEIVDTAEKDENGDFKNEWQLDEKLDECESEFLKSILEDYRIILQKEFEYLTGRQAIIETIEANNYEFLKNGSISSL